ncbi:hypothetical protein Pyrde_1909 [Pyrodictium delaneyi]|uniref:Uncharacterized protein n=1 Tax=Pyrodictium delaneyi TaxID=1273541 RepID=A0A0P0N6M1_9CREN|nr:hypothetical protein [Pyrodictium delaneyi]ALL01952.1 hypothetical protein Pyrde_1909 [Pyrodictium delaneyi]
MQRRTLLLGLGGAGAGAAAAVLVALLLFQPAAETAMAALEILPVLKVYKNGELVYMKVGDPPLENWAKVLAAILTNQGQTLITSDGGGVTLNHGDGLDALVGRSDNGALTAPPVVVAGQLSSELTYNTYWFDEAYTAPITTLGTGWQENMGEYVIKIKGTVTFDSNTTINVVGLAIRPVVDTYQRTVLVFADKLPEPIDVSSTDSLTIVYEIHIKWPSTG